MEHPAPSWVTPSPSPRWGRLERVVRASQGPGLPPPLLSDTGQVFAGRLTCPTNQLPPHSLAQGGVWGDWEEPLLQCPLKTHETGSHLLATPSKHPPLPADGLFPCSLPWGHAAPSPAPPATGSRPTPAQQRREGAIEAKPGSLCPLHDVRWLGGGWGSGSPTRCPATARGGGGAWLT